MNTKRWGTACAVLLSLLILPTLTSAQTSASSPASLVGAQSLPVGAGAQVDSIHISGDVYEFIYRLTTGPGAYHQVGVHRVVRVENGKPIVSHNAAFLVHGDVSDFNSDFMSGTHSAYSLPAYLAGHDIDVWGVDRGWTLIPATLPDYSFVRDWGLQRDIDDLAKALHFARIVRSSTGGDGGRLTLLAHSSGGWVGYGLLDEESQKSCAQRNVKAYIPLDTLYKTNDPNAQSTACANEAFYNSELAQGFPAEGAGLTSQLLGTSAKTDPNGVSIILGPPYTNLQALLVVTAATYEVSSFLTPFFHSLAGTFGSAGIYGIPTGFAYTNLTRVENDLLAAPPVETTKVLADTMAVVCGDVSFPFDDHLKDITVPVLNVGAGGGFGNLGLYTLTLLGSEDVQHYIVSFYPPDEAVLDYGHDDPLIAGNAKDLVWSKILRWLRDHEGDNSCPN
jgi:hypothetical protein